MGERTIVEFPLGGPIKQKTAEPWVDGASVVAALNCISVAQGSYEKRPGYLSPTTLGWNAAIAFLSGANGWAISDGFYVYPPTEGNPYDSIPACVATRQTISGSPVSVLNPTVTSYGGYDLYVWEANTFSAYTNRLFWCLVQESTKQVIRQGQGQGTGTKTRLIMQSSVACLLYEASASTIDMVTFDLSSPLTSTWTARQTLVTDYATDGATYGGFDVTSGANGPSPLFVLTYVRAASLAVTAWIVTAGVAAQSGATFSAYSGGNTPIGAACYWDSPNGNLWVAWSILTSGPAANNIQGRLLNVTFPGGVFTVAAAYAVATIATYSTSNLYSATYQIGIVNYSATEAVVVWETQALASDASIGWGILNTTGAGTTTYVAGQHLELLSKPFVVLDPSSTPHVYAFIANAARSSTHLINALDNAAQTTQMLAEFIPTQNASLDGEVLSAVAVVAPRLLTIPITTSAFIRSLWSLGCVTNYGITNATQYRVAGLISETNDSPAQAALLGVCFDFAHPGRSLNVELGTITYVGGGVPGTFDGTNVVESSCLVQQDLATLTGASTGGNLENGQTYSYIWLPEWRDNQGNVQQGQPSTPVAVTIPGSTGATGSVSGSVPCIGITKKGTPAREAVANQSPMYLVPYRTVFQNGAMGTVYQRLVGDLPAIGYANAPQNGPFISFADTLSDTSAALNAVLPTTGGVLENDCPSSFAAICEHNSRIYGIGDDLRTIWISTAQADGIPCTFNDGSQVEVSFLGDLTAIWSMDQNLLIASATGLAYMQGGGPNITGTQSDLIPPVQIPSDVGCIDPRAWVVTPQGTIFRTPFGLALLDRTLLVHSEFGDPVTKILAEFPVTTAMILHPTRPEVHIYCQLVEDGFTAGVVLVYNYRFGCWTTHILTDPQSAYGSATACAVIALGDLWLANEQGHVFREQIPGTDSLAYYDTVEGTSSWVQRVVVLGWTKPSGQVQGLGWCHQIEIEMLIQDWSNESIYFTWDYEGQQGAIPTLPSFANEWTFTSENISQFADYPGSFPFQTSVALKPNPTRVTAFQVWFQDGPVTDITQPQPTTGQGARIVAMSAEVEAAAGLKRLAAGQRG